MKYQTFLGKVFAKRLMLKLNPSRGYCLTELLRSFGTKR